MGPRFRKRGNQRLRNRAVWRTVPSMGPRFRKRGNSALVNELRAALVPSMGPRFRKRGNGRRAVLDCDNYIPFNGAALSEARKRSSSIGKRSMITILQWGRAFGSAETRESIFISWPNMRPSMGPRFRKRGNQGDSLPGCPRSHAFNGAALSEARKLFY